MPRSGPEPSVNLSATSFQAPSAVNATLGIGAARRQVAIREILVHASAKRWRTRSLVTSDAAPADQDAEPGGNRQRGARPVRAAAAPPPISWKASTSAPAISKSAELDPEERVGGDHQRVGREQQRAGRGRESHGFAHAQRSVEPSAGRQYRRPASGRARAGADRAARIRPRRTGSRRPRRG